MPTKYTLKEGDRSKLGRHPDNDIVPKDATVSDHYAIIGRIGEKLIMLDKENRNGSFVNVIKVQSAELADEDIVKFGNLLNVRVCTFFLKKGVAAIIEKHDDKSAMLSTIERTLLEL